MKKLLWGAVALLYLLHHDVWFWHEAPRLEWAWTLPAGFVYHVGFCVVVALVMGVWVRASES